MTAIRGPGGRPEDLSRRQASSVLACCSLSGGSWYSAYHGLSFTDLADVSIDHVVALAEAWDSGASAWTPERRERFANDLGVPWTLIGVSMRSNDGKSDLDPADWLPAVAGDRCSYLADWLAIKVRWGLAVDQREHDAIASLAGPCESTIRPVVLAAASAPLGFTDPGSSPPRPRAATPPIRRSASRRRHRTLIAPT
jgi:hypothetical protein